MALPENYNKYMYYQDSGIGDEILHCAAGVKPWKYYHGKIDDPY